MCIFVLSQAAAKDAARDAGMSDSDNEEEGGEIRLVKAGEQAAREAAAATAAYNAALAAVRTMKGFASLARISVIDDDLGFASKAFSLCWNLSRVSDSVQICES